MVKSGQASPGHSCPDCGTVLDAGLSMVGLCPHCLLGLALEESPQQLERLGWVVKE